MDHLKEREEPGIHLGGAGTDARERLQAGAEPVNERPPSTDETRRFDPE